MSKITWIHLSDLHFKSNSYDCEVVMQSLIEDIKKQIKLKDLTIDFIFISGDLTLSGKIEEFCQAEKFITKLSIEINVPKDSIIIVPGNHDVNRNDVLPVSLKSKNMSLNRNDISSIIGNESERSIYTKGLSNYYRFIEKNFSWAKSSQNPPLSYTINKKINGLSISILALNTAWLSYGSSNEKGKIILGERQVREALDCSQNPQLTIALMHHPFEWLEWFDANDVKAILDRRTDYILTGHEHKPEIIGKGSIFGKAFRISAGATYESRRSLNSYNIISCDLSKSIMTCYLRSFVDVDGGVWQADNSLDDSIKDGIISINISEKLYENASNKNHIREKSRGKLWQNKYDKNSNLIVPTLPQDLIEKIKNGKCILFAGAGTSLDAGLPSWEELLKSMVEKVDYYGQLSQSQKDELNTLLSDKDYTIVAEFCKRKLGEKDFADFIKEKLNTKNKNSLLHNALSKIPFKAAITSNYDNFIEKTHSNYKVILPEDINQYDNFFTNSFLNDDYFPIFKIHGSYETPQSIVLTDNDYRNIIFNLPKYRSNLKKLIQNKSLLFIGFSFRDSNINLLLQEIFTLTKGMSTSHYAFLNDIGDIKKEFFWSSRNIRVISYNTIDGSHHILNKMLENIINEVG